MKVTKPNLFSCILTRFGVSLSLTICLSALFTKTNRLSRIFNNSVKQVRQASYVSPKSQLVICFSIISVQLIGILLWTIIRLKEILNSNLLGKYTLWSNWHDWPIGPIATFFQKFVCKNWFYWLPLKTIKNYTVTAYL